MVQSVAIDFDEPGDWRSLPSCAGWVDNAARRADGWTLGGWAAIPSSGPFDAIRARWNGAELGEAARAPRPDVIGALYWVPHAERAGFEVRLDDGEDLGRLDLVGERRGQAVARMSTTFLSQDRETAPLPPAQLSERVSELSGDAFRLSGLKGFTDLWDQVRRHWRGPTSPRVLDWGCGCGRVARYLTRAEVAEVRGCDLDADAVAWCAENLPGRFFHTAPDPPLPFADGELDVVLAASVFTHLSRGEQDRWLREIRRVLSGDGLLVASVTGGFAFVTHYGRRSWYGSPGSVLDHVDVRRRLRRLRRAGILDAQLDEKLDGIAPSGYYRLVFQHPDYTVRTWSEHFEVLDYIPRGLSGYQDLVVMRPRPR